MANARGHAWRVKARFRRQAFGWKSQPAIARLHEAVSEIALVVPILGAEGAVVLLERLSPALENVDSSSGAIGMAVNHATHVDLDLHLRADHRQRLGRDPVVQVDLPSTVVATGPFGDGKNYTGRDLGSRPRLERTPSVVRRSANREGGRPLDLPGIHL